MLDCSGLETSLLLAQARKVRRAAEIRNTKLVSAEGSRVGEFPPSFGGCDETGTLVPDAAENIWLAPLGS